MEYMSYGQECVISMVLLLVVSSVILDLLPLLYKRLRRAFAAAPVDFSTRLTLVFVVLFLL